MNGKTGDITTLGTQDEDKNIKNTTQHKIMYYVSIKCGY